MMSSQKERNKELYRLRTECGWSFRRIADQFGMSVERARLICKEEERFLLWPKFRQMLSTRTQHSLLALFGNDATIFNDPERIIAQTNARDLLRCKKIGRLTVAEIVAALEVLGYHLRPV